MPRHQLTSDPSKSTQTNSKVDSAEGMEPASAVSPETRADISVWMIWAVVMLCAVAALPFAVRSQDVVRAIASMCGIDLG